MARLAFGKDRPLYEKCLRIMKILSLASRWCRGNLITSYNVFHYPNSPIRHFPHMNLDRQRRVYSYGRKILRRLVGVCLPWNALMLFQVMLWRPEPLERSKTGTILSQVNVLLVVYVFSMLSSSILIYCNNNNNNLLTIDKNIFNINIKGLRSTKSNKEINTKKAPDLT